MARHQHDPSRSRRAVPSARRPWHLSGWLYIGILWGIAAADAARHTNQNYDRLKAGLARKRIEPAYDGLAFDATVMVLALALVAIFVLFFFVGLIALRRKLAFWRVVLGVFMGLGGSGVMHNIYIALGLIERAG